MLSSHSGTIKQATRAEQAVNPNRINGIEMDAEHARYHELGIAVIEFNKRWRYIDKYVAAAATVSQVGPTPEFDPATSQPAASPAAVVPPSPELQAHAAAPQFDHAFNQNGPVYSNSATPAMPRDVVPQQQFEQPRA